MSIESTTTTQVDYTARDYQQSFDRTVELFGSAFPGVDLTPPASLERLFLELFTQFHDKATYYLNRQGREARIVTASLRSSLLALAKLVGYVPEGIKAARVDVTFSIAQIAGADVTIPAGTIVRTQQQTDAVRFELIEEVVIVAGNFSEVGEVENSASQELTVLSTGTVDQAISLPQTPYLDDSATVTTALGSWIEVANFLESTATARHFRIDVDARDRATVVFGDGRNGVIPTGLITISYKTGGGAVGNVPAGAIRVIEGAFEDGNGFPVQVTVTNAAAAEGGFERESDAMIRVNAPAASRIPKNAVGRTDYEDIALRVPGVGRVLHLTRNQDVAVDENQGILLVVPTAGGAPSQSLLDSVAAQFGDNVTVGSIDIPALPTGPFPKTVTFRLIVRAPTYRIINVTTKVVIGKGFTAAQVKANIVASLNSLFAVTVDARTLDPHAPAGLVPNPRINFGYYLLADDGTSLEAFPYSTVYNAIHDAAGVLQVSDDNGLLINDAAVDPPIAKAEFPALGTVRIINAKTGQEL